MLENWATIKAKALKILGKDAVIPDPKFISKLNADFEAKAATWRKAREEMEAQVLEFQNVQSKNRNLIQQFADKLSGDDFQLDTKDKENVKKIKEAQGLFDSEFKDVLSDLDDAIKGFGELDKHLMFLRKYKPGT